MTEQAQQPTTHKEANIWSSRRACRIAVRISYQVKKEKGCTIFQIKLVEELGKRAA